MSNYIINYIVYTQGHRRHHPGTQTQIIPSAGGQSNQGEHFPVFAFDELPYMGHNLPFAFMSVTGNADNHHLYTTPGNKDVETGTSNIKITIVYAPHGGGDGHGGPGIWVDAFNVDTGDFSDSDFMQVFTNGSLDNAKTIIANNDGVVSSAAPEDLRANPTVDGVPFLEWEKLGEPNMAVKNPDYMLTQNEGGIAFVFYQSPQPKVPGIPHVKIPAAVPYGEYIEIAPGVLLRVAGRVLGGHPSPDDSGNPHPNYIWKILPAKFLSTLAILSIASNMSEDLKTEAVNLAAKHLNSIAESIKKMEIE